MNAETAFLHQAMMTSAQQRQLPSAPCPLRAAAAVGVHSRSRLKKVPDLGLFALEWGEPAKKGVRLAGDRGVRNNDLSACSGKARSAYERMQVDQFLLFQVKRSALPSSARPAAYPRRRAAPTMAMTAPTVPPARAPHAVALTTAVVSKRELACSTAETNAATSMSATLLASF